MSPSPPAFLVPHPPTALEFSQIPVEQDDGPENSPSPTPTYHPHAHRSGGDPALCIRDKHLVLTYSIPALGMFLLRVPESRLQKGEIASNKPIVLQMGKLRLR